ncbi:MAG: type II toxin-antitoxin system RelE/ParE family toxin [Alphaproteobacteria bacterium]|nr:type II toxin-antitoxin system RelE/ParE family toxin [Alphaproteobacteria bacterium]MBF0128696.1 type II toxin-antitoxin system RelE/ParE family toxin [Alphaproteobacteria bacterium]
MRLILTQAAIRALRKLPARDAKALLGMLGEIAADPFGSHAKAKKMTDHPGYRARYGDWRAIYRLDNQTGEMVVDRIGHRSEVYR